MLILLSPAKTLDFESPPAWDDASRPRLLVQANELAAELGGYSQDALAGLMKLSDNLASLNRSRYQRWKKRPPGFPTSRQALLAFTGDSYRHIPASEYAPAERAWAQGHLRILSGLYGVLRPLDLIQAYRLEMGTRLRMEQSKNLYDFWSHRITDLLNEDLASLEEPPLVVNLASNEYFKSVKKKHIAAPIVQPVFKDWKNDRFKTLALFAKRARGAMVDYLIQGRVVDREGIKKFTGLGYVFDPEQSTDEAFVFLRTP